MHFPALLQNHAHNQSLEISPSECKPSELCKVAMHRQVPVKRSFLGYQCHLKTWSTSLQLSHVCFILCKQAYLIETKLTR